jgi:hypothetical protein
VADRRRASLLARLGGVRAAAAPRARTVATTLTRPIEVHKPGSSTSGESTATT